MAGSSLIPFHRVLISIGIVFCAGFGVWMLVHPVAGAGPAGWMLGVVFLLLALVLLVYLWNLRRVLGLRD
ncbi:MAG: hypothetical protein ABR559_09995 [Gemmatimonadota bacterium]